MVTAEKLQARASTDISAVAANVTGADAGPGGAYSEVRGVDESGMPVFQADADLAAQLATAYDDDREVVAATAFGLPVYKLTAADMKGVKAELRD